MEKKYTITIEGECFLCGKIKSYKTKAASTEITKELLYLAINSKCQHCKQPSKRKSGATSGSNNDLRKAETENNLNKAAGCNLKSLERNKHHPHLRLAAPITMRFDPEPEDDETSGGGF